MNGIPRVRAQPHNALSLEAITAQRRRLAVSAKTLRRLFGKQNSVPRSGPAV